MNVARRLGVFILTNLLIVGSISVVLNIFGVQPYLTGKGIDFQSLITFCLVWGFGGAFISLALSRPMAKWMMGVKVVDKMSTSSSSTDRWLLETVSRLSYQAGLTKVPEVGIYNSPEVNAFATGPTRSRALVAVSSGLMETMDHGEIEAVVAHEIAHIANGDMVTMTLLQGVINAFVMFFARTIAWSLSQFFDEDKRGLVNMVAVFVFEVAFSLLGMVVVAFYSRHREYRADSGGADLVGKAKMVAALKALQGIAPPPVEQHQSIAAFKISDTKKHGLLSLIATHPPLEERIKRLHAA